MTSNTSYRAGRTEDRGRRGILRQALLNLAKNAVQAMPDGGTLTMACAPTKDGRVEIRITDTGVGISPENLAQDFRPLLHDQGQSGTGIGLSLVYRTIQLHNGDIDVESTPGKGHDIHHQDAPGWRLGGGTAPEHVAPGEVERLGKP